MQGDVDSPKGEPDTGLSSSQTDFSDAVPSSSEPDLFSGEDLDRLYREALEVMEAAACELTDACTALSRTDAENDDSGNHSIPEQTFDSGSTTVEPIASGIEKARQSDSIDDEESSSRLTATEIIEAVLFVGGTPLTTKKLCGILRGDFTADAVDQVIDSLNRRYADENRPYLIQLGEGGYRLTLAPEYESVRNRVFGFGPKEVRLSQDALEVLALIAYRQPMSRDEVEAAIRENPGSVLRHLVRRELISVHRAEGDGKEVRYVTSPRFLKLFGLSQLDELPQADELEMK